MQLSKEESKPRLSGEQHLFGQVSIIVEEINAKEKLWTLYWENKKSALKARLHPLKKFRVILMQIHLKEGCLKS